jgi:hypothetical protein
MKKTKVVLVLAFISFSFIKINAQYFYNDIIITKQTNAKYNLLLQQHIHTINAKSFEANNSLTPNFKLQQIIDNNAQSITTIATDNANGNTLSIGFYKDGKVTESKDSAVNVANEVFYTYDASGLISEIKTVSSDTFMNSLSTESHLWFYKDGVPDYMYRIKEKTDTTLVQFKKDEQGNIAEERWIKKDKTVETYYYYYNTQHQLTDIVRFNIRAKRLLPDFLFEYDNNGLITEFTQIPQGVNDYYHWVYNYDANGLKESETCFNKQKQLLGKIAYSYE